jgi:hypothetical protein
VASEGLVGAIWWYLMRGDDRPQRKRFAFVRLADIRWNAMPDSAHSGWGRVSLRFTSRHCAPP